MQESGWIYWAASNDGANHWVQKRFLKQDVQISGHQTQEKHFFVIGGPELHAAMQQCEKKRK